MYCIILKYTARRIAQWSALNLIIPNSGVCHLNSRAYTGKFCILRSLIARLKVCCWQAKHVCLFLIVLDHQSESFDCKIVIHLLSPSCFLPRCFYRKSLKCKLILLQRKETYSEKGWNRLYYYRMLWKSWLIDWCFLCPLLTLTYFTNSNLFHGAEDVEDHADLKFKVTV